VLDYLSILIRWRDHFAQLLNAHRVNYVRLIEIHTSELLVPEPGVFKFEMAVEKLTRHNDRVLIKYKQEIGRDFRMSINLLILLGIRKNCLSSERS
jgi:hypothetical protein